ncbi:MAG TPA: hypothetical protein VF707_04955 [Ardenticatenaceae bacterium]|jgi:hypothetical protein
MERYDWSRLNPLQVGKYAEYFVKMEFTLYAFDVYTSEVDDKGIDFVVRRGHDRYYDIQVKSVRNYNYIFFPKAKFELRNNLLAAVVIFLPATPPQHYLIPSTVWHTSNALFTSKDYEGLKSKPEWGINLSRKNHQLLQQYSFDEVVLSL